MSAQPEQRMVPTTVTHDEFAAAIKPLLDLLNVTSEEVYRDIHITDTGRHSTSHALIAVTVVARAEGDDSPHPTGVTLAGPVQEWAELSYRVTTEVV